MKCVFGLLTAAAVMPTVSALFAEPKTEATKDTAADTKKLDKMVAGLTKVINTSAKGSKLASTIAPWVTEVSAMLKEVHSTDKKLTQKEKEDKIKNAEASIEILAEHMAQRGSELVKESQNDKTNLLMGVLLSRKDQSMDKQYDVLESKEFSYLNVVKYVEQNKGYDTRALVVQCGEYLDNPDKYVIAGEESSTPAAAPAKKVSVKKSSPSKKESPQFSEAKEKMVKMLEAQVKKIEKNIALHNKEVQAIDSTDKKAMLENLIWMKNELENLKSLKMALAAAETGDLEKMKEISSSLNSKMNDMISENNSFLQVFQKTKVFSKLSDCPYCKAQCFEKCHDGGKPYLSCMGECAAVGN